MEYINAVNIWLKFDAVLGGLSEIRIARTKLQLSICVDKLAKGVQKTVKTVSSCKANQILSPIILEDYYSLEAFHAGNFYFY